MDRGKFELLMLIALFSASLAGISLMSNINLLNSDQSAASWWVFSSKSRSSTDSSRSSKTTSVVQTSSVNSSEEAEPLLETDIPSLYGYSKGTNSYLIKHLNATYCADDQPTLEGSVRGIDYVYNVYNMSLANLDSRYNVNDFYKNDLSNLIECARKTGKLRIIYNVNFWEYDSVEESPTGKKLDYQKKQLCRTTGLPMSAKCIDTFDDNGNVIEYGYIEPNIEDALAAFDRIIDDNESLKLTFSGSGYAVLAGITLAEENVTWDWERNDNGTYKRVPGKRADFLEELYFALKDEYPHWTHKFLQWYSPNRMPNYPGYNDDWPEISADGWVFDQYHLDVTSARSFYQSEYYTFVREIKRLNKPVYSIVFASPLRYPTGNTRGINSEWWNSNEYEGEDGGWVRFYGQVAINQMFKIPTIYYVYTPIKHADIALDRVGLPDITNEDRACGIDLLNLFRYITWPHIEETTLDPEAPLDEGKPFWIPSAPTTCEYLNEGG